MLRRLFKKRKIVHAALILWITHLPHIPIDSLNSRKYSHEDLLHSVLCHHCCSMESFLVSSLNHPWQPGKLQLLCSITYAMNKRSVR
jgi:hypothetical protein